MKSVLLNKNAKDAILAGIDRVANELGVSIGPAGGNALIGRPFLIPEMTNDAKTILDEIEDENEHVQAAIDSVKDVIKSVNDETGDGRKTTALLIQAIAREIFSRNGNKSALASNRGNPMRVMREVRTECAKAVAALAKSAKKATQADIESVAISASESEETGKGIARMLRELGPDGMIFVMEGGYETEFETIKGLRLDAGLPAPQFENEHGIWSEKDPLLVVTDHAIDDLDSKIRPLINEAQSAGRKSLVLIADSFSREVLQELTLAHSQDVFTLVAIKPPAFGNRELYMDYACMLGARFIDRTVDMMSDVTVSDMGTCSKAEIGRDKSIFVGIKGDTKKRIESLKKLETDSGYDAEQIRKRISTLSGGFGIIRVGGHAQKGYQVKKVRDAVNSARSAMTEGVVKRGGLALKEIADSLDLDYLRKPLCAPYDQMRKLAGDDMDYSGYDSAKVQRVALEKACDLASLLATVELVSAPKREKEHDPKEPD